MGGDAAEEGLDCASSLLGVVFGRSAPRATTQSAAGARGALEAGTATPV
jgi:hypothetical protein